MFVFAFAAETNTHLISGLFKQILYSYEATTAGSVEYSEVKKIGGRVGYFKGYDVKYRYRVENQTYYSDQVELIYRAGNTDEYIEKYKLGNSVLVYYDPTHPMEAILDPSRVHFSEYLKLISIILSAFFIYWSYGHFDER